jgi:predicted phage terminase large subunit-like protein
VTAKKYSDYTVGLKLGILDDETLVILDIYRVQKAMPDVEKAIAQNAAIDGRQTRIRLEAEKAGIVQLDYLLERPDMRGYTIDKKPPVGDKYTRAQPFASRVNGGKVKMVRASWNRAYLDELAVFPMGAHDDQVDASSGAYDMLVLGRVVGSSRRYA